MKQSDRKSGEMSLYSARKSVSIDKTRTVTDNNPCVCVCVWGGGGSWGGGGVLCWVLVLICGVVLGVWFSDHLDEEEKADCFTLIVLWLTALYCVAMGWSAFCHWSWALPTMFYLYEIILQVQRRCAAYGSGYYQWI